MGIIHSGNTCCMREERKSILEMSFIENSFDEEFIRDSNYESPIPDEVFSYSSSPRKNNIFIIEEYSTNIEKAFEINEEPGKNYPRRSSIKECTQNLLKPPNIYLKYTI